MSGNVNVLMDLDGTLTDPRVGMVASIKHALSKLGYSCPADHELQRYIGPPLQDSFAVLLNTTDSERIDSAIRLYRERYSDIGLFENSVYPGIPEALLAIREFGASLYVATSKPTAFAERIIERFELARFFDAIHGSELDGTRSKKGDVIAHALRIEGLSPKSTLMVGDRLHDIVGARRNGVFPVGVLWGYGSREELEQAGAGAICMEPISLPNVLSSEFSTQWTAAGGGD